MCSKSSHVCMCRVSYRGWDRGDIPPPLGVMLHDTHVALKYIMLRSKVVAVKTKRTSVLVLGRVSCGG